MRIVALVACSLLAVTLAGCTGTPRWSMAEACEQVTQVQSELFNAEDGHRRGMLDAAAWQQRVDDAWVQADELLAHTPGVLLSEVSVLTYAIERVSDAGEPFEVYGAVHDELEPVRAGCEAAGFETVIRAEHGG